MLTQLALNTETIPKVDSRKIYARTLQLCGSCRVFQLPLQIDHDRLQPLNFGSRICHDWSNRLLLLCGVQSSKLYQLVLGFLHTANFGLPLFVDSGDAFLCPFDEGLPLSDSDCDRHSLCLLLGTFEGNSQTLDLNAIEIPKAVKAFSNLETRSRAAATLVSGSILTGTLACSSARFRAATSTFVAQSSGLKAAIAATRLRTLTGD